MAISSFIKNKKVLYSHTQYKFCIRSYFNQYGYIPELVDNGGLPDVGDADDDDGLVRGARPVVAVARLNQATIYHY